MKMARDRISGDAANRLAELAEGIKKAIDELKEYERWVNERRAEEIEEFHTPYDEFCDRLEKQLDDLWKELVDIVKPFGEWESFDDCVGDMRSRGYSEESAKRICGSLQAKLEKEIVGLVIDLVHELDEFVKSNPDIVKDKRPPKEWFDRCVERTGRPALCGWVFYHHLYPTKPPSKREPDEPHTREARARKRKWLGG
jgi:hypothetical protein